MKRGKACTMAKVKYITSANEIPAEQKFLLVMYGYPDYSSSAGWPYFAGVSMTTPPATAAEAPGSPCDATMRRPQRLSSGLDHRNRIWHVHAVGMTTKR
jgi:hypothetical protein